MLRLAQNFLKYVEVVRKNVTRGLTLGLLFTHVAEKEGLKVMVNRLNDVGTLWVAGGEVK